MKRRAPLRRGGGDPLDLSTAIVVVTGASSGIGAAFARALAARGADLVLVARRADRLGALAADLRAAHGVAVTPVARDLAAPDAGRALHTDLAARGLRVTGLVNNAGFGASGLFTEQHPDRLQEMIALDVAAVVDLSHAFLPDLTAASGGFLVNVASVLAYQPAPRMAVYAAAKAFVLSFTEALWEEHRATGPRVLCVSPSSTDTEFFDVADPDGISRRPRAATPERVVAAAFATLERRNPPPSIVTDDRFVPALARALPRRAMVRAVGAVQRGLSRPRG